MTRGMIVGVGFVAVVVIYAAISGLWVGADPDWYEKLPKPPWQPPDWVFGVIWPLNFLALATAGISMARVDPARARPVLVVLAVSVIFALGWAYLFYVPHALAASAASLAVAALLTWSVLILTYRVIHWAGLLLVPYAIWMSLATSLAVWYAVSARPHG